MQMFDPFILQYQALITSWDGDLQLALQQQQQAIDMTENSIINLQDPGALISMQVQKSVYLKQIGRLDEAVELLRSLLQRYPADPIAKLELATVLFELGQTDAAAESLSQLLELWSNADPEYLDFQRAQTLKAKIAGQF